MLKVTILTYFKLAINSSSSIQNINNWRLLIWKKRSLFNLIIYESDIHIYLYAKDPYGVKHQPLINKRKSTRSKHLNYSKAFIEYSNDTDDIYKNIE